MELWVLNKKLEKVCVIDAFESFVWTVRYSEAGEFELKTAMNTELKDHCEVGNYMVLPESDRPMIINKIEVDSSSEEGMDLTIKGMSLEYILSRRSVWHKVAYDGSVHDLIKRLITENVIEPSDPKRKIPEFIFEDSTDPRVLEVNIEGVEYFGENLYTVVHELCAQYDLGIKAYFNFDTGKLHFGIFKGVDRTGEVAGISPVWFSPEFENLSSSNYEESIAEHANSVLLIAEDVMGSESEQPKDREVTTKTASKTHANGYTTETETTEVKLISRSEHQISRKVEVVQKTTRDPVDPPEYTTPGRHSYVIRDDQTTITTVREYNSANTQISYKYSEEENSSRKVVTVDVVSAPNGLQTNKVSTTETKTDQKVETEDTLDIYKHTRSKIQASLVYDASDFVTSETSTVTYFDDITNEKDRMYRRMYDSELEGLERRELFVDATNTRLIGDDKRPHKVADYENILKRRADNELRRVGKVVTYTGEVNPHVMYRYPDDYYLGDIVRVTNESGMMGKSKVAEIVFAQDVSKLSIYPTFVSIIE